MTLKKVLLLNPPADRLFMRDMYCGFSSKAHYLWEPTDQVILSGLLGRHFHVTVRECIGDQMSLDDLKRSLDGHERFDFIISLTAARTLEHDLPTFAWLREKYGSAAIIVVGDFVREAGVRFLREQSVVDACLLSFTNDHLVEALLNWDRLEAAPANLVIRRGNEIMNGGLAKPATRFSTPLPHHEKFPLGAYRQPHNRRLPVATVLASEGCPYTCAYCTQSSIDYRLRPAEEVFNELAYLHAIGVREIFFLDQLMGANPRHLKELCARLVEAKVDLSWGCNVRADTVSTEVVQAMRQAGCHAVFMGIETHSDAAMASLKAKKTVKQTEAAIHMLRRVGISVNGYFILGLPGEDEAAIDATIRWARRLDLDFAIFSQPSPDYGTQLREMAKARGLIENEQIANADRTGTAMHLNDLVTPQRLEQLLSRAYRSYYLRPRVVLRLMRLAMGNPHMVRMILENFASMMRRYFLPKRWSV